MHTTDVISSCKNYFNGFNELSIKGNISTNAIAVLKIVSYFFLVIPAIMGATYGIASLIGRIKNLEKIEKTDQKVQNSANNHFQSSSENSAQDVDRVQPKDVDGKQSSNIQSKNVKQIQVYRQGAQDSARCGVHALKNAIQVVKTFQLQLDDLHSRVNSRSIYEEIDQFVNEAPGRDSQASERADVSIAILSERWETYANKEQLDKTNLSIFNYDANDPTSFQEYLGGCPSKYSLQSVINLVNVYQKVAREEGITHVFLIGGSEHWSVVILESKEGKLNWTGLDSMRSQEHLNRHVDVLQQLFPPNLSIDGLLGVTALNPLVELIKTLKTAVKAGSNIDVDSIELVACFAKDLHKIMKDSEAALALFAFEENKIIKRMQNLLKRIPEDQRAKASSYLNEIVQIEPEN